MNFFLAKHHQIFSLLIQNEVEFIVVGGYAVIYHGYHRTTGDLDIWLKPDNYNKNKFILTLEKLGYETESISQVGQMDFTQPILLNIGEEPDKVEFMTFVSGLIFEEANEKKIITQSEKLNIPFLSLDHLIISKMNAGRFQDLADIEKLQKVIKLRRNP